MYYTLVVYDLDRKRWVPEFGDPDKAVVVQERADWKESLIHRPCHLRILRTAADEGQRGIDLAVEELTQWARGRPPARPSSFKSGVRGDLVWLPGGKSWREKVFSSPKTALVDAR